MKKQLIIAFIFGFALHGYFDSKPAPAKPSGQPAAVANQVTVNAFRQQKSDIQVKGTGVVERILPDDTKGSRHQKFILRLPSGLTLLVAHNIDLAPRINSLRPGDTVEFNGEYKWNDKGGVLHWTHHDPARRHEGGWLIHRGARYQ